MLILHATTLFVTLLVLFPLDSYCMEPMFKASSFSGTREIGIGANPNVTMVSTSTAILIQLKQGVDATPVRQALQDAESRDSSANRLHREYDKGVYHGFAGTYSQETVNELANYAHLIETIEKDQKVRATAYYTDMNPRSWGLVRISQRIKDLYWPYYYPVNRGVGVEVYILDSGIQENLWQFGGRAKNVLNFVTWEANTDTNGHGTHVAGVVGSRRYGVARGVKLFGLKVLDFQGEGSYSDVVAGINYVASLPDIGVKRIINLSLGGPSSTALDYAISTAVQRGIVFIAASGNEGADACNLSPADNPNVFTVGAMDDEDKVPSWSNSGPCVNIYAPGVDILSVWRGGNATSYNIKKVSGTSMAAPHISGIAALLMGGKNYTSADQVYYDIHSSATTGVLNLSEARAGSKNLLGWNNAY